MFKVDLILKVAVYFLTLSENIILMSYSAFVVVYLGSVTGCKCTITRFYAYESYTIYCN